MATMSPEQLKAEYDKTVGVNTATDAVIQSVVKFLKEHHYEKHETVKNLVTDALDQYGKIIEQKEKSDAAVKENDYEKAILFENMIWQYMVKTADVGIRAKDSLVRLVATKQSEAAAGGERAFNEGGCSGCHVIGKVSSGPDLTGVLQRHENGEKWVADFIKHPQHKFDDPYVKGMIDYFNLKMPDQHMNDKEIQDIIEYFKWIEDNANLF